jgi:hypothetical protein
MKGSPARHIRDSVVPVRWSISLQPYPLTGFRIGLNALLAYRRPETKSNSPWWPEFKPFGFRRQSGAGNRDRTGDIQLGKLAFYR